LAAVGAAHRFGNGAQAGVQSDFAGLESTQTVLAIPRPEPDALRPSEPAEVDANPARAKRKWGRSIRAGGLPGGLGQVRLSIPGATPRRAPSAAAARTVPLTPTVSGGDSLEAPAAVGARCDGNRIADPVRPLLPLRHKA
jgi:hypothetical protein